MDARHRGLATVLIATAAVKAAVIAIGAAAWTSAWMPHLVQDIVSWRPFLEQARRGLIPYVDFSKEYPVGAGMLYALLARLVDPADTRVTVLVHALVMSAVDVFNAGLFYRLAAGIERRRALVATLAFALNPTALVLGPVRYEGVVVSLVLLGYAQHRRGRPMRAVLAWSIGCWLKWFPAFFIAAEEYRALVMERALGRAVKALAVFLAVGAAVNLPFIALAWQRHHSLQYWLWPYRFHATRPLYWDTLLGVGQIWLGPLPFERYGSLWSLGLIAAALLVRPRMRLEYKGALVCIAAILVNRIHSTQFHLWFYPFLILGLLTEPRPALRRVVPLLVALDLTNVLVYPFAFARAYGEMGGFFAGSARDSGGPWTAVFSAAIVLRAALLAGLAALLVRWTARAPGPIMWVSDAPSAGVHKE
jgi:hypothetical protein